MRWVELMITELKCRCIIALSGP